MPSILEEFAYGNVSPETQTFPKDSSYGRALELVAQIERELLDRLGAQEKELFIKYIAAQGEVNQLGAVRNCVYGYKLGMVMTAEAFVGMDDLYLSGEKL